MRKRVWLIQAGNRYGPNVFVPYSVGCLIAYAKTVPEIRSNFVFDPPLFWRQNPTDVASSRSKPSIVGFSNYLWNWRYNQALAQNLKAAFPDCLIVWGGPQVPNTSEGFFVKHPYVDLLVHGEGELSFAAILQESLSCRPDFTKIPGLSLRLEDNETHQTPPAKRIDDLSKLPSPYLEGVFDFMLRQDLTLNVVQETNRGCPYSCAFCYWGGNDCKEVLVFDEKRILEEFEWFGQHGIEYLFNGDANFGLLDRDPTLVEKFLSTRAKYGDRPRHFRMCTAKQVNRRITERVYAITAELERNHASKGATVSFQSLHPPTLAAIGRHNIADEAFYELMGRFQAANIKVYTELILALPEETYDSVKLGIDRLFERRGAAVSLFVSPCILLPNSRMSDPAYREKYRIKTVPMPVMLAHSTPNPGSVVEYEDVVVETASMPHRDWQNAFLFYWAVQTFHCLGLLPHLAVFCQRELQTKYSDFYEEFMRFPSDSVIGQEFARTRKRLGAALRGEKLDQVLPVFGEICWPPEEASFLNLLVCKKKLFYEEVRELLARLIREANVKIPSDLVSELVRYQMLVVKGPDDTERVETFHFDFPTYFACQPERGVLWRKQNPLQVRIKPERDFGGDLTAYAKEILWYGRKGGAFHHEVMVVSN